MLTVWMIGMLLVSCRANRDIEEKISSLQSQPIKLCLDEMRCRNKYGDTVVVDSVKPLYRMVVYVDPSACSPCTLDKMFVWNESIKKARRLGSMLKHVFIVAPKPEQFVVVLLSTTLCFKNAPSGDVNNSILLSNSMSI